MQFPTIRGFQFHRHQGSGPIGHVFEATWEKKQRCAVKVLRPTAVQNDYVNWCLSKLVGGHGVHPNVGAIYTFHLEGEPMYIASQWAGNASGFVQTFGSVCGKWPYADCLVALRRVAEALAWLHSQGIIHTALTVRNVLLAQQDQPQTVLVTDVAQGMVDIEGQPIDWGTHLPYFCPERLRPEEEAEDGDSGDTMDIYAFGVVAYRLLTDAWPRAQKTLDSLERARTRPIQKDINDLARQLERETTVGWKTKHANPGEGALRRIVEKCLALKRENRYSKMTDVLAAMSQIPGWQELSREPNPELVTREEQKIMRLSRRAAEDHAHKAQAQAQAQAQSQSQLPIPPQNLTIPAAAAKAANAANVNAPVPAAAPVVPKTELPPVKEINLSQPIAAGHGWPKSRTLVAAGLAAVGFTWAGIQFSKTRALQAELASAQTAQQAIASSKADLDGKVGGIEGAKATAVKAQQVAEANLRQQQGLTSKLFDSLIDFEPEDPIKRDQWREQIVQYAERAQRYLEAHGKEADQKETCTIARWHLGATAQAFGDASQAEKYYDECTVAIDSILASYTGTVEHNEWLMLQGKVMSRRGQLYLESGRSAEASQAFAESLKALDQWIAVQSNDTAAARERIMVLLMDSRALRLKAEEAGAAELLTKAVKEMDDLMQTPARRADDVILLAKLQAERGTILASLKNHDEAQAAFLKAYETLRDFDRKNPKFQQSREVLAEIYGQFGTVLEKSATPADALMPLKESAVIWADLLKEKSTSEAYCLALGRVKVRIARIQKALQKLDDARSTASEAVTLLENLSVRRKGETRYKLHLGIAQTSLSEFYEDQSKWVDAAKFADAASQILSEPGIEAGASVEEHREAMLNLARALTTLGHASNSAKQKDVAKDAYNRAQEAWQQVVANGAGETDAIKSSIEFVKKELGGL